MRISSCLAQPENFQPVFMLANYYETRKRENSMKKALRITLNSIMSITIVGLGVTTGFTVYQGCMNESAEDSSAVQDFQNKNMRGNRNEKNQMPDNSQQPPEIPDGEQPNDGQQPPEIPNNDSNDDSGSASDRRGRRNNSSTNQSSVIETTATESESEDDTKNTQNDISDNTPKQFEGIDGPTSKKDLLPYFICVICETFGATVLLTYLIISRFNKYSIVELMSNKK